MPEDVRECIMAALDYFKKGSVFIDLSTTDYHNTLQLEKVLLEKGVNSLEAPVSNLSHLGIEFANASIYVGGDVELYERVKKYLDMMARISFHVAEIGKAQSAKLLTNI